MAEADSTPIGITRTCVTCGESFKHGPTRGEKRLYCREGCRPLRAKPTKQCSVDGCVRVARSNSSPHCEAHYYQVRRNGRIGAGLVRHGCCQYCGKGSGGNRFCTARCRARHDRSNPRLADCAVCGAAFCPLSDHGRDAYVCSPKCTAERARRQARAHYAKSVQTEAGRNRYRSEGYKRRARKVDATVEAVDRDEVMRRSKWRCHLCSRPIPKNEKHPSPLFGTVDHVLPLCKGGAHSYANVKAAHLSCNCAKGSKPIGQMGLAFAG